MVTASWSGNPYFAGDIDDVAIYPTAIPLTTVQSHYTASGRTLNVPTRPTDAYGQAVWDANPDLYWRLGDTTGTAKDSGPNESNGTYQGGYTQGQAGAFDGATNKAVAFNGSDGFVASNPQYSNPHNYSLEAWFKTTTDQRRQDHRVRLLADRDLGLLRPSRLHAPTTAR